MAIAEIGSRPIGHARTATIGETRAGRAGFLAALIMLATQLAWRLNWTADGVVQAFPELVVAALARLTPLSVFGAATENYGSLAKKTLFFGVLIGIAAVGSASGQSAGRLARRLGSGFLARLAAGSVVAGVLLLVTFVAILPIAHLGFFGSDSSYAGEIRLRLVVTFALYAVAWALLATPFRALDDDEAGLTADDISRRAVLNRAVWGGATLVALCSVGGLAWRLINPRASKADLTVRRQRTQDIVATQRARNAQPTPATSSQTSHNGVVAVRDEASLRSDVAFNAPAAAQDPLALFTQLDAEERLTPVLTSIDDFYHVSKNISDPTVNQEGWSLKIGGLVTTPIELTYDQLVARATTKKITTLCCISNELNGDLISTAEWTGVPLAELLTEAGVQPNAVDLKFHCADDYEDSIPVAQGLDPDTLIVVGMNGEPLPDDHGFPARMIVPGIYGMKNVKWLESIEAVDHDFQGYWQTRGWSDPAPYQIWGRIDYPKGGDEIAAGLAVAAGLASAGDRGIQRVEVSLDDGQTWADATLEPALNPPFTWVRWAYQFEATPGEHTMRIRATDGTGKVAEQTERPPLPDGPTGWPKRDVEVKG